MNLLITFIPRQSGSLLCVELVRLGGKNIQVLEYTCQEYSCSVSATDLTFRGSATFFRRMMLYPYGLNGLVTVEPHASFDANMLSSYLLQGDHEAC